MNINRLWGAASLVASLATAFQAHAIDTSPGDYTLLPPETAVALQYFQYSTADELNVEGVGDVPGTQVDAVLAVSRVLYYGDAGGVRYGLQAYLPYGGFTEAKIGGSAVNEANGLGDLTVGATAWLIEPSNPVTGTTLAATAFLTMPTGSYDASGVSIGSGTYTVTPQIGFIQGLGAGFFFDGTFDVALSRDHDEGGVTLSRDPSYQVQTYLRYQPSQRTSFSIGYSGKFGGEAYSDGAYTGSKTRVDSLRIFANHFLTPTVQIEAMLSKDFNVEGGPSNTVTQIRLLKVF
ncbi:transporter [Rhizobium sp. S-51]|uniref:Transporter n=1 Tax=Rhizobium terricola TaxID=2728849 RepID=A0A7Y0B0G9_9HYPH|nr:transporter [Rhizobium terricola]NML76867.1 transporter [Rhizobium terricola]